MQVRSKFVVSVVSLLGLVACGDDDGGSGSTGGVSSSKKIGDLSESEARSLCRSMVTKMKKIGAAQNEFICIGTGIALGQGDADACEDAADDCRTENDGAFELDCEGEDGEPAGKDGDCADVTVGEFNACLDATVKSLEAIKVSCTTDLEDIQGLEPDQPKACTDIADRCDVGDMAAAP